LAPHTNRKRERRLLYIAMTRAKDDLHLVVPQRFFVHGQHARGNGHLYAPGRASFLAPQSVFTPTTEKWRQLLTDRLNLRFGTFPPWINALAE
jgi:superfamily I DNA/RNA helicase